MTRINAAIPTSELCDEHLKAELREIVRIPRTIISGKAKIVGIPPKFKLQQGHVKFFYDKIEYLHKRQKLLYLDARLRGFNVQNFDLSFLEIQDKMTELYNDWQPEAEVYDIVNTRIQERLGTMKRKTWTPYKNLNDDTPLSSELLTLLDFKLCEPVFKNYSTMPYFVKNSIVLLFNSPIQLGMESSFMIGHGFYLNHEYYVSSFRWINTYGDLKSIYMSINKFDKFEPIPQPAEVKYEEPLRELRRVISTIAS